MPVLTAHPLCRCPSLAAISPEELWRRYSAELGVTEIAHGFPVRKGVPCGLGLGLELGLVGQLLVGVHFCLFEEQRIVTPGEIWLGEGVQFSTTEIHVVTCGSDFPPHQARNDPMQNNALDVDIDIMMNSSWFPNQWQLPLMYVIWYCILLHSNMHSVACPHINVIELCMLRLTL